MTVNSVCDGVSIVDIPEARLSVLCGCPENVIKFMFRDGLIGTVEKDGRRYETGPNAILLSELPIQNGRFCNVGEFPVLQMLYRQGMIIPRHPNNDGTRPMIIGMRDQLEAQAAYIYLGNYGITDPAKLDPADPAAGADVVRMKRKFAFGAFKDTRELLDLKVLDSPTMELRNGAYLRRLGINRYEFIHGGHAVDVDMNLSPDDRYGAPYSLPSVRPERHDFSVVHLGEGDGWDFRRPCMSSLILYRGEAFLVDAGPNIEESLDAVGIGMGDLRGVFHTHIHDDHFVGLTALMRADRRLLYCAVPMVRRSATAKLEALCGVTERQFSGLFEPMDLVPGQWNDVDGLEAMPIVAPHPLENTVFRFRASGPGGDATYAHYADLSSFAVIDSLVTEDVAAAGISKADAERFKAAYLEPADVKKVDVGGGMIHGDAADFRGDLSGRLFLSHGLTREAAAATGFGEVASFGEETVLITATADHGRTAAVAALKRYFPDAPRDEILELAGCRRKRVAPGAVLIDTGDVIGAVYLTLDGLVMRRPRHGLTARELRSGALLGANDCVLGLPARATYSAIHDTEALCIPADAFMGFIERNDLGARFTSLFPVLEELYESPLFAELHSLPCMVDVATASRRVEFAAGLIPENRTDDFFWVVAAGSITVTRGPQSVERLGPGDVFGEEALVCDDPGFFEAVAEPGTAAYRIPASAVSDKPSMLWKLRELFERRLAIVKAAFDFRWRDEYALGVAGDPAGELDRQHRELFEAIGAIDPRLGECAERDLETLEELAVRHFSYEQGLMGRIGYPGLPEHLHEHELLLAELDGYRARLDELCDHRELVDFLKDCLIRHMLVMDRRYLPWLEKE